MNIGKCIQIELKNIKKFNENFNDKKSIYKCFDLCTRRKITKLLFTTYLTTKNV